VDETVLELCIELMMKERPDVGMTGWRKWIQDTEFDVKKKEEGYGQGIPTGGRARGGNGDCGGD